MAQKHYDEQFFYTDTYLIKFLSDKLESTLEDLKILEIGCAEGGFIAACIEKNISVEGLELEPSRVEIAKKINPNMKNF